MFLAFAKRLDRSIQFSRSCGTAQSTVFGPNENFWSRDHGKECCKHPCVGVWALTIYTWPTLAFRPFKILRGDEHSLIMSAKYQPRYVRACIEYSHAQKPGWRSENEREDLTQSRVENRPQHTHIITCVRCGEFFFAYLDPKPTTLQNLKIVPTACVDCESYFTGFGDRPTIDHPISLLLLEQWARATFVGPALARWTQDTFPNPGGPAATVSIKYVVSRHRVREAIASTPDRARAQSKPSRVELRLPSFEVGTQPAESPVGQTVALNSTFLGVPAPRPAQSQAPICCSVM